jgi:hypothetical protein
LEPIFAEPRPPSDIIQILPGPDLEEVGPAPMAGRASTGHEINSEEIAVARASGPPTPEPAVAPAEMREEIPEEIPDLAAPRHHSVEAVEARAGGEAAGSAEQELPSTSEPERTSEAGFSAGVLPTESEHPVEPGTMKSSIPRRGWWQRLIQP